MSTLRSSAAKRKVGSGTRRCRTCQPPRKPPPPCLDCGELKRVWVRGEGNGMPWVAQCVACTQLTIAGDECPDDEADTVLEAGD